MYKPIGMKLSAFWWKFVIYSWKSKENKTKMISGRGKRGNLSKMGWIIPKIKEKEEINMSRWCHMAFWWKRLTSKAKIVISQAKWYFNIF